MRLREYICRYRLSGRKNACVFETSCTAENRAEAIEFLSSIFRYNIRLYQ